MIRVIFKWLGLSVLALIALVVVATVGALTMRHVGQTMNAEIGRIVAPNGIDESGYMTVGGVRQWVTVRGQDKSLPVLLYLHGGPGGALSDVSYLFQRTWEDYFTVVQWDQRGFGRSDVDRDKIAGTVTRTRYVDDAIDLIEQLKVRLKQPKVIVVGQSWGSVLALEVAHKRPDLLYAVVTVGQVAAWDDNFTETRRLLIDLAQRTGDQALLAKMNAVGPLPPSTDYERFNAWIDVVQGEMMERGYSWHNSRGSWGMRLLTGAMLSPSVSDGSLVTMLIPRAHRKAYMAQVLGSLSGWRAATAIGTRLEVPWVMMQGDWDWQTPTTSARVYFDSVCAPWKKWVSFQNSAHVVTLEEPGKTIVTLVNDVLPAVRGEVPAGAQACKP